MPIYQPALLYGKNENRLNVALLLGVPDTRITPTDGNELLPHVCIEDDVLYLWNVTTQAWVVFSSGSDIVQKQPEDLVGGAQVVSIDSGTGDGFLVTVVMIRADNAETGVKIGTTLGGDEIMISSDLEADKWYPVGVLFTVEVDTDLHITNMVGTGKLIIYKNKI